MGGTRTCERTKTPCAAACFCCCLLLLLTLLLMLRRMDYGGTGGDGPQQYYGMTNFGNLLTITYLNHCAAGRGTTIIAPGFHRTANGQEGPVRERGHEQRGQGLDPPGTKRRTISGVAELEAVALYPSFAPGDLLICDSWLPHRVDSNVSSIGRPCCGGGYRLYS